MGYKFYTTVKASMVPITSTIADSKARKQKINKLEESLAILFNSINFRR